MVSFGNNLSDKSKVECQAPVAHACNPSYSGGKYQEDRGLKPARANSSVRLYLGGEKKNLHQKRGRGTSGVAQGVTSEFKHQYHKKEK
jgi:hypothetical protein